MFDFEKDCFDLRICFLFNGWENLSVVFRFVSFECLKSFYIVKDKVVVMI